MLTPLPSAADLLQRFYAGLSQPEREALQRCVELCAEQGTPLYLVGGAVRDLLLERPSLDLDLALEGDAAPVAEALASATGGRAAVHTRFGTATVRGAGFQLDLARTRSETYSRPGALPDVAPAQLTNDLARRDFSINAMALRLTDPPELVDSYRGVADLRDGLVRVLHERSFQDDATRMLRAVRYAARLGFKLEALTEAWLRRDLAYLNTVSGPRLRRELVLLFNESSAPATAAMAQDLGILSAIHPCLGLPEGLLQRWQHALAGPHHAPLDELGFCLLAGSADEAATADLSRRLHLAGRFEKALLDLVRLRALSDKLASSTAADALPLLDARSLAAVWALALLGSGRVAIVCGAYLNQWRQVKPLLRGNDLQALGIKPGPALGEMLQQLRLARIRGQVTTREDEVALVQSIAATT